MTSGLRRGERPRKNESRKRRKAAPAAASVRGVAAADADAADSAWDAKFDAEFARDQAELERSGRVLTRVLFFVFLSVAVLMIAIAVLTGVNTQRKLAREMSTLGQITGLTERKDSQGNSFFYPVVTFEVADGGQQNVQLSEGSWPPSHRVGDLVTVLYDSLNPLDARIQSSGGTSMLWTWTIVAGILGIAFLGATVLAWAIGRSPA